MKTTLFGVVAALVLSTSFSIAHAQDPQSVQVKPTHAGRAYIAADDVSDFRNKYALSNGQQIAFTLRLAGFYAQLEDGKQVRLYATSRKSFVSADGVEFDFRDSGETVAISDFQKLPMANVAGLPSRVVMMAKR